MDLSFLYIAFISTLLIFCGVYILTYPAISKTNALILFFTLYIPFSMQLLFSLDYLMLLTLFLNSILLAIFSKKMFYFISIEISYIICCIVVNTTAGCARFLFHFTYKTTDIVPNIVLSLINLPLICLIFYLLRKLNYKYIIPTLSKLPRFVFWLVLFLILICCYIIYTISYFSGGDLEKSQLIFLVALYIVFVVITTVMVLVLFHSSKKQFETQQKMKYLENLNAYTENLELLYNNLRSFKHDYVNIMTSLSAYIDEKQYDKLEVFFYEHILPMKKNLVDQSGTFNNLLNINILELKSIIYSKLLLAVNQNIDITIDIPDSIDSINMDSIDLIRILGIFFDNAIEAALETTNPVVNLHIGKMNENVIIIISNNFIDKGLSVAQMQQKNITTKGEGHGIGLHNVSTILNRYNHVYHETNISDQLFSQEIHISAQK